MHFRQLHPFLCAAIGLSLFWSVVISHVWSECARQPAYGRSNIFERHNPDGNQVVGTLNLAPESRGDGSCLTITSSRCTLAVMAESRGYEMGSVSADENRMWENVLGGPGWQSRGPIVAAHMARRLGKYVCAVQAEDVFQESLKRGVVWVRQKGKYDIEEVRKVLHGIMKNVAREYSRRKPPEIPLRPDLPERDPHSESELQQVIERFRGVLEPRERDIFQLKFMEGYSQGEIAKKLGISDATVSRAVKRIRQVALAELAEIGR